METMHTTRDTKASGRPGGFSLIELMVVVAVIALLVALALPSYKQFIRKSNRGEAQQLMMNHANLEEIWRANNSTYANETNGTGIPLPVHDDGLFTFFIRATASSPPVAAECAHTDPTATAYTVVACAQGDQVNDKDQGVSCARMSLSQANAKTPAECW